MKYQKLLITLAFAVALGAEARAVGPLVSYLSQTNSFIVNPVETLDWNKFDSNLGTLTGISFSVNAVISGSFTVTNTDPVTPLQVTDSDSRLRFQFSTGTGSPGSVFNSYISPIPTLPSSDSTGSTVGASSSRVFDINAGTQYTDLTRDFFSSSQAYFTGSGTVISEVQQFLRITSTGEKYSLDSSDTKSSGTAVLTYIYQVPEPSAASLLIFGLGGLVAVRCVRRKS